MTATARRRVITVAGWTTALVLFALYYPVHLARRLASWVADSVWPGGTGPWRRHRAYRHTRRALRDGASDAVSTGHGRGSGPPSSAVGAIRNRTIFTRDNLEVL